MLYSKFLSERKSIRKYKDTKVGGEKIKRVRNHIFNLQSNKEEHLYELVILEDGSMTSESLKDKGGYAGVMIEGPHYIGLVLKERSKQAIINGVYDMESTITVLTELGLGSCWISLNDVEDSIRNKLVNNKEGYLDYLLVFGYPEDRSLFEQEPTSSRLSIEEIVYENHWGNNIDIETLEKRGLKDLFYYIRFAPSNLNSQPWRFIIKDDRVLVCIINPSKESNLVDGGIIMYYFEKMVHDIGVKGTWKVIEDVNIKGEVNYSIIGEFLI